MSAHPLCALHFYLRRKRMNLERNDGESLLDFHKRIVYGKLVDKTLADIDYTELSELIYGREYSSDVARRMFYGSRITLDLLQDEVISKVKSEADSESVIQEIDEKIIDLQKEKQKFYDQRTAFNKAVREQARKESLYEILQDAIAEGSLPELDFERRYVEHGDNDLIISLNDIHYGLEIDNYWGKYNSDIFHEMLNSYANNVIEIAERHGSENLVVCQNGDAISGNIHRTIAIENKENVIEQVKGVSNAIANFLNFLSPYFKNIYFVSVSGNHSRITPNKNDAHKDERLDDLIEWYLEARLQDNERVHIGFDGIGEKIDTTMYYIDVRGKTYCGVHGDYDMSDRNILSLPTMLGRPVYAVLSGHIHSNKRDIVQGIKTFRSGSFVGMDDYCIQKRIFGNPEQMVIVANENGAQCFYDINFKK